MCPMFWEFTSNKGMKPRCEGLTQWESGSHPASPSCLLSCLLRGHFVLCSEDATSSQPNPNTRPEEATSPELALAGGVVWGVGVVFF